MKKPPAFWYQQPGWQSSLLSPLSKSYTAMSAKRQAQITPWKAPVPVICIGNFVIGGAGKTPLTQGLVPLLHGAHILSRGYGRDKKMALRVDPQSHTYKDVGDEPLLLAQFAPTWVGPDRPTLARLATQHEAKYLFLDDGFQNPSLHKDLNLVVVDSHSVFGNEHVFPAGPLREPLDIGLERADALVLVGRDNPELMDRFRGKIPVTTARVVPNYKDILALHHQNIVAFAGLARPQKFFNMLDVEGLRVDVCVPFPDHHSYTPGDLKKLLNLAKRHKATLVTTQKDLVRLPMDFREHVQVINISVSLDIDFFQDIFRKTGIITP